MVFNNSLKIHSPTSDRWHQVVRIQSRSRTRPSMKSATSNQRLHIFHLIRNQTKQMKYPHLRTARDSPTPTKPRTPNQSLPTRTTPIHPLRLGCAEPPQVSGP